VAATHPNGAYLGPAALGLGFTPAAPRETVILYGNGFGRVSPAIVPGAGLQAGTLPFNPTIANGGLNAKATFAGAISPGLYQFDVVAPSNVPNGDNAVVVAYQGTNGAPGIFLAVTN
jgi:uncharacterized protein (TIGR03437 family)